MRLFRCGSCGQPVYFENTQCTRCGTRLGFVPDQLNMAALEPTSDEGLWQSTTDAKLYKLCSNYAQHDVCNWLVPANSPDEYCVACRLNRTIPDLNNAHFKTLWSRLETDKRRLVYSLLRLKLPIFPQAEHPEGMAFDFLADIAPQFNETDRVLTGHKAGVITLNIAEADPVAREQMRTQMAEPYRTILGHFRHESGHYYWDRLIWNTAWLEEFRQCFGDEREDYAAALDQLYQQGPPADWQSDHVSAYASCHPWEDWAETWAHYLHLVDTLETAYQFGLSVHPREADTPEMSLEQSFNPYDDPDMDSLIAHWLPLTYALNSLNRSMGHDDLYPFVLSPGAIQKLAFVHRVIHSG